MGEINKVKINKGQGGTGAPLPNNDHISGILYENATLPTPLAGVDGFDSNDRVKKLLSLQQLSEST